MELERDRDGEDNDVQEAWFIIIILCYPHSSLLDLSSQPVEPCHRLLPAQPASGCRACPHHPKPSRASPTNGERALHPVAHKPGGRERHRGGVPHQAATPHLSRRRGRRRHVCRRERGARGGHARRRGRGGPRAWRLGRDEGEPGRHLAERCERARGAPVESAEVQGPLRSERGDDDGARVFAACYPPPLA